MKLLDFSKKERTNIILAVTIGNLLEWYEIYLYIHWTPIIARLFFHSDSSTVNTTYALLIFAIGFLARPFGGIFFGRLGDRIGRRKALLLSLSMMTVPTFVTGLLPTYAQIGYLAPLILGLMRLFQSFPAGGELPGAFCYLYESARPQNRRFMCSWAAVGYQLGILISTFECYLLDRHLSHSDLVSWGWRASFLAGGVIGLLGLLLRYRLHETPLYKEMVTHEQVTRKSLLTVINVNKEKMALGFLYCEVDPENWTG